MTTQPEALRLADELENLEATGWGGDCFALTEHSQQQAGEAATELRRLSAVEAQRDALLEALKSTGLFLHHCWCDVQMNDYSFEKLNRQMEIVDAAIKAVEETK